MSQRSDLKIYDERNNSDIAVTIQDSLEWILNSPLVTQVFLRALAKVVVSTIGGAISEVIVTIDEIKAKNELHIQNNRVNLTIAKLDYTAKEYARALRDAEGRDYPQEVKDEWVNRLYGAFYAEMADIAPSRRR